MKSRLFQRLVGALAVLNLGMCLASAVLLFLGRITSATYRTAFLLSSIAWFVFATLWTAAGNKPGAD